MSFSCLKRPPVVINIPRYTDPNFSIEPHPTYESKSKNPLQALSTSITRSVFPAEKTRLLFSTLFDDPQKFSDESTMPKTTPLWSIFIYFIVGLVILLVISIVFCWISCSKGSLIEWMRGRMNRISPVNGVIIFVIVQVPTTLLMFSVAFQLFESKRFLSQSMTTINHEIYPKEIAQPLIRIQKQLSVLDLYFTQPNSIFFNGSKSIVLDEVIDYLRKDYFVDDINDLFSALKPKVESLFQMMKDASPFLPPGSTVLQEISTFESKIAQSKQAIERICVDFDEYERRLEKELRKAFHIAHEKIDQVDDTFENDVSKNLQEYSIDPEKENAYQSSLKTTSRLNIVFVLLLGCIPWLAFVSVLFNYHQRYGACGWSLCIIRIGFSVMLFLAITLLFSSVVLYAGNLIFGGLCRTIHEDQSMIIDMFTDKVLSKIQPNTFPKNFVQQTLDDCENRTHWTSRAFHAYSDEFHDVVVPVFKQVDQKIFDHIQNTFAQLTLSDDIKRLDEMKKLGPIGNLEIRLNEIIQLLKKLDEILGNIQRINKQRVATRIITRLKGFFTEVLESTFDECPLPWNGLVHIDEIICHKFYQLLNGFWLKIFIFVFFATAVSGIVGLILYRRFVSDFE